MDGLPNLLINGRFAQFCKIELNNILIFRTMENQSRLELCKLFYSVRDWSHVMASVYRLDETKRQYLESKAFNAVQSTYIKFPSEHTIYLINIRINVLMAFMIRELKWDTIPEPTEQTAILPV